MDITCPKCGTANRNTSRFCAKCGEALPHPQDSEQQRSEGELNLPWLQAVHEKAVKQTGGLNPNMLPDADPTKAAPRQEPPNAQREATAVPESAASEAAEPAAEPAPQASSTNTPDEPPPDWVVGILEPGTEPAAGPEQTYEPEELKHIMPWLTGAPEPGSEPPQTAQTVSKPDLPPWLSGMTVQETLQTSGVSPTEAEKSLPDATDLGIEGLQPFVPPEASEQVVAEPVDTRPTSSKRKKTAPTTEKVPDWLKPLAPEIGDEETPPPLPQPESIPRFGLEPTGALIAPIERDIPVRPPRPGSVETLAALLQASTGETMLRPVPGMVAQTPSQGALRQVGLRQWLLPDGLIYLAILVALVTVLVIRPPFGEQNAPAARDVIDFYNAVEVAPANKPVLLVYDWDATRSAEMSSLADAVTRHLMSRRLPFVTVSLVPQGPGFAQEVTDAAKDDYGYQYGRDYLALGYLPGNEAALGALVSDFNAALPLDYVNARKVQTYSLFQSGKLASISNFGLIINLASDEATLRAWIEQVATRTRAPLIAAVPQGLEPMAQPYKNVPGAGLKAILSGQAGALRYIQQMTQRGQGTTGHFSTARLADRLNAQSVAQILVALVILAAFVNLGARRIFRR